MISEKIKAERISNVRTKRGLTQQDMAKMLSEMSGNDLFTMTKSVQEWESGVCFPSLDMYHNLAIVLSVPAEYLMGLSDIAS